MKPHTLAVFARYQKKNILKFSIWIKEKKCTVPSPLATVRRIFKIGCGYILLGCSFKDAASCIFNHVLTRIAHFKPRTNHFLKRPMTLCRQKAAPLRNWKVICESHQGLQFFSMSTLLRACWKFIDLRAFGFVAIKIFHGMMDDKVWNKILRVHPLGKYHIEITLKKIIWQQSLLYFLFRYSSSRKSDQLLRKVYTVSTCVTPYQTWSCLFSKVKFIIAWDTYETAGRVRSKLCHRRPTTKWSSNKSHQIIYAFAMEKLNRVVELEKPVGLQFVKSYGQCQCVYVPIMLLRDRSWILFWFGPSGAPQNDTGE